MRAVSKRMQQQQQSFAASEAGQAWADKRAQLPVVQVREQLIDHLANGSVAVLSGDTGCGKTTQVPQYLLEHEIAQGRGGACQIVCTQPRRLAAISVAERVAAERGEPPPGQRGSRIGRAPCLLLQCCEAVAGPPCTHQQVSLCMMRHEVPLASAG